MVTIAVRLFYAPLRRKPILPQAKQIHAVFEEKCGAILCKDLKGRDTGVILCECDDCVRNAIEVIHELFED